MNPFAISAHTNYSPSDARSVIARFDQPHLLTLITHDVIDVMTLMTLSSLLTWCRGGGWDPTEPSPHLSHSDCLTPGPRSLRPGPGAGTGQENGQRERLRDFIKRPEQITQTSWAQRVCTLWGLPSSWWGYDCTLQAISLIFNSTSLLKKTDLLNKRFIWKISFGRSPSVSRVIQWKDVC